MAGYGFIYKIKPELKNEYQKAHDEIWPEQTKALKDSGFRNYSMYYREDGTVFSYLETEDFDKSVEILFKSEVNKKWQEFMEKYFDKTKSDTLGPEIVMLEKIWQLEE